MLRDLRRAARGGRPARSRPPCTPTGTPVTAVARHDRGLRLSWNLRGRRPAAVRVPLHGQRVPGRHDRRGRRRGDRLVHGAAPPGFAGHTLAVVGFPGAAGATLLGVSAHGTATSRSASPPRWSSPSRARAAAGTGSRPGVRRDRHGAGVRARLRVLFVSLYGGSSTASPPCCSAASSASPPARSLTLARRRRSPRSPCSRVIGRPLLFASVDPDVAAARGVPVRALLGRVPRPAGLRPSPRSARSPARCWCSRCSSCPPPPRSCSPRARWLSFVLTVVLGLVGHLARARVAYFSVYPVGFCVTTLRVRRPTCSAAARLADRASPAASAGRRCA